MKSSTLLLLHCLLMAGMFTLFSCGGGADPEPPVNCATNGPTVALISKTNPTACLVSDGAITVSGAQGQAPYQFKIDNGPFQSVPSFSNLGSGTFLIGIKDANGCESTLSVTLDSPGNISITNVQSTDTTCGGTTGSITVTATGTSALTYRLNNQAFQAGNSFSNLAPGNYTITVADANGCTTSTMRRVLSGVMYTNDILPILQTNCSLNNMACHSSSSGRGIGSFTTAQQLAQQMKRRVALPSTDPSFMPRGGSPLSAVDIARIACWADDGAPN